MNQKKKFQQFEISRLMIQQNKKQKKITNIGSPVDKERDKFLMTSSAG